MTPLTDDSIMPFGKHRGQKMVNVPDDYLLHLWKRNQADYKAGKLQPYIIPVMQYIEDFGPENLRP